MKEYRKITKMEYTRIDVGIKKRKTGYIFIAGAGLLVCSVFRKIKVEVCATLA